MSDPNIDTEYFFDGFIPMGRVDPAVAARFDPDEGMLESAIVRLGTGMTPDGFIRLIAPGPLLPLMDTLLPSKPGALPVFATAWGDLVVLHENVLWLVLYRFGFYDEFFGEPSGYEFDALEDREVQETILQRSFYDQAVSVLGVPALDECFGFVLPLAAGGLVDVSNVARRTLADHLVLLVQTGGAPRPLDEVDPPKPVVRTEQELQLIAEATRVLDALMPATAEDQINVYPEYPVIYLRRNGFEAQLLVGDDGTMLHAGAAVPPDALLDRWRQGERTDIAALLGGAEGPSGVS